MYLFCQIVRSVSALSDRPVVDTRVGVLEAILGTRNEHIGALEWKAASKNVKIVPVVAKADRLQERFGRAEERELLMSGTIREHGPQLTAGKKACSRAEAAFCSGEYQSQVFCVFKSPLQWEVGLSKSYKPVSTSIVN